MEERAIQRETTILHREKSESGILKYGQDDKEEGREDKKRLDTNTCGRAIRRRRETPIKKKLPRKKRKNRERVT